jgi:hypothetical protein
MPQSEEIAVYSVLPKVISVLDYSKECDTPISSRFEQHPPEEPLMEHFTPVSAAIGGVLIGLSATMRGSPMVASPELAVSSVVCGRPGQVMLRGGSGS